jgi:hypothetical protein
MRPRSTPPAPHQRDAEPAVGRLRFPMSSTAITAGATSRDDEVAQATSPVRSRRSGCPATTPKSAGMRTSGTARADRVRQPRTANSAAAYPFATARWHGTVRPQQGGLNQVNRPGSRGSSEVPWGDSVMLEPAPISPFPAARGRAARSGCARTLPRRRCRCTLAPGSCRSRARRPVV